MFAPLYDFSLSCQIAPQKAPQNQQLRTSPLSAHFKRLIALLQSTLTEKLGGGYRLWLTSQTVSGRSTPLLLTSRWFLFIIFAVFYPASRSWLAGIRFIGNCR